MSHPPRLILLLACLTLSLIAPGCAAPAAPTPSEQALIDQGNRLHRTVAPAVLNEDVNLRRYVQQVGQRLTKAAEQMHRAKLGPPTHFANTTDAAEWMFGPDMRFQLLDCDVPNAFTPGGTHLYLYNALFQRCQTEEELAAALAHVYGHLYARHRQQQTLLPDDADPDEVIVALINNRHSPQEEAEADAVGFQLFARAGYDPLAYASLPQRLDEPARADAARALANQLPIAALDWARPPIADTNRFAAYQQSAAAMARTTISTDLNTLLTAVPSCLTTTDSPDQLAAQEQLLNPTPPTLIAPAPFEKGPRARPR
jgi:predicted Zn-dependent protease